MNFNTCLQWLNKLQQLNTPSSLSRFTKKLHELGCYPTQPKIFTVAGTNGKGTSCVTLESILLAAGYKTGCYLSPHLRHITERFRTNGQIISEAEFSAAVTRAESVCTIEDTQWFEFLTLVAMIIFAQHPLDFLILEVGIGGKQDIVNAIDPDVAIITSIDLDHTEVLGNTREQIGAEKAGIFRAHKPTIYAEIDPPDSVLNYAEQISADLMVAGCDYFYETQGEAGWIWRDNNNCQSPLLPYPKFPIANAAGAIAGLSCFASVFAKATTDNKASQDRLSWDHIIQGLKNAFLPGRFQILQHDPLVIIDVAHNPHAARYLAEQLRQLPCLGNTYAVVGMQTKKDISNTLEPMLKVVDQWYISNVSDTTANTFVQKAQEFFEKAATTKVIISGSISTALNLALKNARTQDRIIIFGSFLTIEEVLTEHVW